MSENKIEKAALVAKIEEKEGQLSRAESEASAWNKKGGLNTSHAKLSNIMVESLRKEISTLHQQLAGLSDNDT